MDVRKLLAERTRRVEFSGIRKFFELASKLQDPCDLSIGMPDYDAPLAIKESAIAAIREGKNRYTPSAGMPELRERIARDLEREVGTRPEVLVTAGVSGGLTLVLLAILDPGDEVIFLDPYFVSYLHLVNLVGGRPVTVSSYPDFSFKKSEVEAKITPRTKAIIINSPGNPTGRVMSQSEVKAAAELAESRGLLLISDEIYERLTYDGVNPCPLAHAPNNTVLLRGLGKTYGITGWRMGYAAGPSQIIHEMTKLHQYTYVCAPSMAQAAAVTAMDTDVSHFRDSYAKQRDLVCGLMEKRFEFTRPSGGFYLFPRVPAGYASGEAFAAAALNESVLVIPGGVFSGQDTHFRLSYAASDAMLRRGCEVLCRLAKP